MENQHRKIIGYRELAQEDIDLMNKVKALGPLIEEVLIEISLHNSKKRVAVAESTDMTDADKDAFCQQQRNADPIRWLAEAKIELQTGLMYATRAVAQPEFF